MCKLLVVLNVHPKIPTIVLHLRDEFLEREAGPLQVCDMPVLGPAGTTRKFLCPRDLKVGGTWIGLDINAGSVCALTNVRSKAVPRVPCPAGNLLSRGLLVPYLAACKDLACAGAGVHEVPSDDDDKEGVQFGGFNAIKLGGLATPCRGPSAVFVSNRPPTSTESKIPTGPESHHEVGSLWDQSATALAGQCSAVGLSKGASPAWESAGCSVLLSIHADGRIHDQEAAEARAASSTDGRIHDQEAAEARTASSTDGLAALGGSKMCVMPISESGVDRSGKDSAPKVLVLSNSTLGDVGSGGRSWAMTAVLRGELLRRATALRVQADRTAGQAKDKATGQAKDEATGPAKDEATGDESDADGHVLLHRILLDLLPPMLSTGTTVNGGQEAGSDPEAASPRSSEFGWSPVGEEAEQFCQSGPFLLPARPFAAGAPEGRSTPPYGSRSLTVVGLALGAGGRRHVHVLHKDFQGRATTAGSESATSDGNVTAPAASTTPEGMEEWSECEAADVPSGTAPSKARVQWTVRQGLSRATTALSRSWVPLMVPTGPAGALLGGSQEEADPLQREASGDGRPASRRLRYDSCVLVHKEASSMLGDCMPPAHPSIQAAWCEPWQETVVTYRSTSPASESRGVRASPPTQGTDYAAASPAGPTAVCESAVDGPSSAARRLRSSFRIADKDAVALQAEAAGGGSDGSGPATGGDSHAPSSVRPIPTSAGEPWVVRPQPIDSGSGYMHLSSVQQLLGTARLFYAAPEVRRRSIVIEFDSLSPAMTGLRAPGKAKADGASTGTSTSTGTASLSPGVVWEAPSDKRAEGDGGLFPHYYLRRSSVTEGVQEAPDALVGLPLAAAKKIFVLKWERGAVRMPTCLDLQASCQ